MATVETTEQRPRRRSEWDPLVDRDELPDIPFTPREGWTTLIALVVMVFVVAVAINDAAWAGLSFGSGDSQTGFLPIVAVLSVLLGSWLAKSELSLIRAHFVGSAVGAVALLYFISGSISAAPALEQRLRDLNLSVSTFINEVFVHGARSAETSVFLLLLGSLIWAAGQFAAFAVLRRHRPLPAIVLAGAIMLLNVLITVRDQYAHLVIFVAAALVLVIRLNLFEQAREWRSRGMRDVSDISTSFLRSGAAFVIVAIVGSTALAANASSAPLGRVWNDFDDELLEIGFSVNRWLGGVTGAARGPNILFTPNQTLRDVWFSSTAEVFRASVSDGQGRRWRGATYDSFDGQSWQQLDPDLRLIEAGTRIFRDTPEAVVPGTGWEGVSVTVTPAEYGGDVYVAPAVPLTIDQPSELVLHRGDEGFLAGELSTGIQSGVPYTVESLVRLTRGRDALTATHLASAGTAYPDWVDRYRRVRPESIGETVYSTARAIRSRLPSNRQNPYHVAVAIQDYLYRGGDFTYSTDVRGLCAGEKRVDCFLRVKTGFCEHFATAMVMMLRSVDIPARYVLGYLPGREQDDGMWLVDGSAAHAWVEVFFPGYGWVEFDPTPGNTENGQRPTRLLPGDGAIATPGDGGFIGRGEIEGEGEFPIGSGDPLDPDDAGPFVAGPTTSWLPAILILAIAALVGALGLWAAWRRIPSAQPELAYNAITRLATRLGYGPRPAQTAYEYADRLGEMVPPARNDLALITTAKVEATYGRREPGESLLLSIAEAYRRVRLGLLRLLFRRRPSGPRGPRSPRRRR